MESKYLKFIAGEDTSLTAICAYLAKELGASASKVFADGKNHDILRIYQNHGFSVLGSGQVFAPDQ